MMATEPSINNPADVSASTKTQSIPDAKYGQLEPPSLNGGSASLDDFANKHITNVEDQINSADVSVSGGSDTEASRTKDGDKGHGRTSSSTRKPATFKAVSVNKTFLASKANPAITSKTSDKPAAGSSTPPTGSANLLISRPRLVAKTGSGARDSIPRFSSVANGGKPAAAPDPSAVWNKNRPTPAPEPKKFTDEELKKYGIHMASRLNEDDTQGQNKWADIDDDDEDWAPEAITWGDGTKTTLPHSDEQLPRQVETASTTIKEAIGDKPVSPAPSGAPLAKPGGLPSGKGLVLKSAAQEKPALVAKPPAPPVPTKSPWATLPPVKKMSPGLVEPAYPSRGPPKEAVYSSSSVPPPSKDIAADDFSRTTWRDRTPHGNKELYNSRSGRYEPVTDRRGSMRSDSQTRHPAVLQRAPQADQPAEPSLNFQTSRTAQEGPFARRRGSSNVSGGSGSYLQRINKNNDSSTSGPELLGARRSSLAGSVESPVSPTLYPVPSQSNSRHQVPPDWASRPSPGATYSAPHGNSQTESMAAPPRIEDDIEFQKKLMREGIELARKRRQEEEAREEAARRERIQKKLEALGPPPEKKNETKDALKNTDSKTASAQEQESNVLIGTSTIPLGHTSSERVDTAIIVQDEMVGLKSKDLSPTNILPPGSVARRASHGQEAKPTHVWSNSGSRADRFSTWVAGAPPRNVWGAPDNDKGLGNGTFNPDLGRIPGATQSGQSNAGSIPIAPPSVVQVTSQGRSKVPTPIGSRTTRYGALGTELASKWVNAVAENDKQLSATRLAERAGRERQLAERGMPVEDVQPTIKDTWRPVHVPGDGTRRLVGSADVQPHNASGSWKASREDFPQGPPVAEDTGSGTQPGVIGVVGNSVLSPAGPAATPQSRPSRFFPPKDVRVESSAAEQIRPSSPSPPPPTMEGHPVYEGDTTHPHVSLPKPQPVVRLPPSMVTAKSSQPKANSSVNRISRKDTSRSIIQHNPLTRQGHEISPENWQDRINNLLNGGKSSPPKYLGIDPASRNALDQTTHPVATTVSLPGSSTQPSLKSVRIPVSKPMAEECFEEQEMGSLPQIRLPHKAPEAAWQPASPSPKPFPKKMLVQASAMEPYYFGTDVVGGANAIRIHFAGMPEPKTVSVPHTATRGSRGHSRPSSRHRGSGHTLRGGKRDPSNAFGDLAGGNNVGRGGRGGYRSRGSENWSRFSQSREQSVLPT